MFSKLFCSQKNSKQKQMKQKVAFINAFPSDTFLREFNFADCFYTFSGNNFCD